MGRETRQTQGNVREFWKKEEFVRENGQILLIKQISTWNPQFWFEFGVPVFRQNNLLIYHVSYWAKMICFNVSTEAGWEDINQSPKDS